MGEQLSDSNLESSLSPSYDPTALLHTTHPAHGKLGTHWRPPNPAALALLLYKGQRILLSPWLGLNQVEPTPPSAVLFQQ